MRLAIQPTRFTTVVPGTRIRALARFDPYTARLATARFATARLATARFANPVLPCGSSFATADISETCWGTVKQHVALGKLIMAADNGGSEYLWIRI